MASLNKVCLLGNLGRDPEGRATSTGGKVVSFSLATSEAWSDKASGERKEKTQWHRVSIFNEKLGEVAEKYLRKGSKVYVEGALESRKFTDKDGQEREVTEVVLSRFRGELVLVDPRNGGAAAQPSGGGWEKTAAVAPKGGKLDDDIPF